MIFGRCIDFRKTKTSVLLIALRGDEKLYTEAIRIFYKLNWFRVDLQSLPAFELISKKALQSIQKLIIK
jgi:hypothetical protein